ncbi:MAG: methionine--tRNA ligase, partial [Candidatus Chisholmbacteria bacterium RIFCSPHIGHO2_01_FULL_48_12]
KKDLVDGKCPEHLKEPEWVEEENYFFRLSKYQERIEKLIETDELRVLPQTRKNEVLSFIRSGLEDFSISRSRQRAKNWGIPVPRDESQIIYTWFDGLNIYQTGVGFGYDENLWQKWWPADVHVIGKGIIRFHAVYWIGMLLSAGLSLPKSIFVHGYIASGGQKMSKSLGNVIDPFEVIQKYGAEALRYYLLREIPAYGDGDFTYERFEQLYNADLANGLGNMVARVAALAERAGEFSVASLQFTDKEIEDVRKYLDEFRFDEAMKLIWSWIADLDRQINDKKPWTLSGPGLFETLTPWVKQINKLGVALQPFMPETAEKILTQFKGPKILSQAPLFPRF